MIDKTVFIDTHVRFFRLAVYLLIAFFCAPGYAIDTAPAAAVNPGLSSTPTPTPTPTPTTPSSAPTSEHARLTIDLPQRELRLRREQLRIVEDTSGTAPASAIAEAFDSGAGRVPDSLNMGIRGGNLWIQLRLRNAGEAPRTIILSHDYAPTDDITVYRGDSTLRAGDSRPVADSPYLRRLSHFALTMDAGEEQQLLLRLRSSSNVNLNLRLSSPEHFIAGETQLVGAYGMYLGAVLTTVCFLALSFFFYREATPLTLAVYLLSFGAYVGFLNGLFTPWLSPLLGERINGLHLVAIGMLYGSGALFYRRAMNLPRHYPRLDRWLHGLQWAGFALPIALAIPSLRLPAGLFYLFVTGIAPLINSALAVWLWRQGNSFAGVFAIGWLVAHGGALLNTLRIGGVLELPPAAVHLPALGGAIAIPCFAWGIARRMSQERGLAYTDALTGLANRHRFEAMAHVEMSRARRYDRPLSLLIIDADHFKSVNDQYGHAQGDEALRIIARAMESVTRATDCAARIGGEEFAMLMIESDHRQAAKIGERLRERLLAFQHSEPYVTVSIGVAQLTADDERLADFLARADEGLYAAKSAGRNRVALAPELAGTS